MGYAWLALFQVATLEGWSGQVALAADVYTPQVCAGAGRGGGGGGRWRAEGNAGWGGRLREGMCGVRRVKVVGREGGVGPAS